MPKRLWTSIVAALVGLALILPVAAPAQEIGRIAAVVNDQPITETDLDIRLRLALVSAGLPNSPEARQRFLPQVLRQLVDERLQLSEARRSSVTVPDSAIQGAVQQIASQNGLTPEQLFSILERAGVPSRALIDQITAQLAWRELIRQRFVPQVNISEADIDEVIDRMRANQGRPEFLLAEIFLPVDQTTSEAEVQALAERLVSEIRRGAPFPAVARQFSQAAGAQNGGDMGWILGGQLEPALDAAIQGLQTGQVSAPVRTLAGYHILLMRDRRTVSLGAGTTLLRLYQLVVPVPPGSPSAQYEAVTRQVDSDFSGISGCDAFQARATAVGVPGSIDAGDVPLSALPPPLANVVANLPNGQLSPPVRADDGIALLMVCSRTETTDSVNRNEIRTQIGEQRLDILQRRLMRDIRATAFIDIRI